MVEAAWPVNDLKKVSCMHVGRVDRSWLHVGQRRAIVAKAACYLGHRYSTCCSLQYWIKIAVCGVVFTVLAIRPTMTRKSGDVVDVI